MSSIREKRSAVAKAQMQAIKKVEADAAKGMAEGEAGGERIEGGPEGHFYFAGEEPDRGACAEERTVEHHAGTAQHQILERLLAEVVDHEEQLGPDDATDKQAHHQVGNVLRVQANFHAAAACGPHTHHEAGGEQNAVPRDFKIRDFECGWMHAAR